MWSKSPNQGSFSAIRGPFKLMVRETVEPSLFGYASFIMCVGWEVETPSQILLWNHRKSAKQVTTEGAPCLAEILVTVAALDLSRNAPYQLVTRWTTEIVALGEETILKTEPKLCWDSQLKLWRRFEFLFEFVLNVTTRFCLWRVESRNRWVIGGSDSILPKS